MPAPNTASVPPSEILARTAAVVAAYLSKNDVGMGDVPKLIRSVYASLSQPDYAAVAPEQPKPAVPISRSVQPGHIVCLEDGKRFSTLKRHLKKTYNMTPDEYRKRWGLPADYPMVAPNYSKRRSDLAKELGLGRRTAI